MSKSNIWQWSETAASNSEIDGIDISGATGKVKDGDNAIRELMSQLIEMEGKGTSIASAATLTLTGAERYFHITGNTGPITDIDFTDAVDGRWAWLIFDSTPTLTHNGTTLQLPGNANITAAAGDRALFVQDSSDNVICLVYQRAAAKPLEASGSYTPTLTNTANLDSSTASVSYYMRVGDVVSVSGNVTVDPTAAAATTLGISLPIASDLSSFTQLAGHASNGAGDLATITGDITNNRATLAFTASFTVSRTLAYTFQYVVL